MPVLKCGEDTKKYSLNTPINTDEVLGQQREANYCSGIPAIQRKAKSRNGLPRGWMGAIMTGLCTWLLRIDLAQNP